MDDLSPGAKAPPFSLPDQSGKIVSLTDFVGQTVVLYFYPKDDTPGCTTEACSFRDEHSALRVKGAVVLGVSPDGPKKHAKFIEKFALPFSLLADETHAVAEAYQVWVEKSMYGKKYMGVERSTFLIAPDGTIKAVFRKVKPAEHVAEILAVV